MPHEVQVRGRTPEEIRAAEEKKKKEDAEAKDKKKAAPKKEPKYYDIKLECMVPCLVSYRVLAEDENDAIAQIEKRAPTGIKPNISKKRNIKATVYDAGSSIIRFAKSFRV
jgi:hypothetical protein